MKMNYDPKADALDIVFKKGRVHETKEIGNELYLDVDKKGNPLSLEILDASKRLSKSDLKKVTSTFSTLSA